MSGKPSVSKELPDGTILSEVREMNNGGAYIPLPRKFAGKKVRIQVLR